MKIICLVKFVPDVDKYIFNMDDSSLSRENSDLIINPDDAAAVAFAVKLKEKEPSFHIQVVSMAPLNVMDLLRDLLRVGVDDAVLLTDRAYAGSDTYATAKVLGRYLQTLNYDLILSGSHSLDGDTAHIPVQVAELLGLTQISGLKRIYPETLTDGYAVCEAETEESLYKFKIDLPAVLSLSKDSGHKLPFVRYADLNKFVDDRITLLSSAKSGVATEEAGLRGSLTKVVKTYNREFDKKNGITVQNDSHGIETVYRFLKSGGFI